MPANRFVCVCAVFAWCLVLFFRAMPARAQEEAAPETLPTLVALGSISATSMVATEALLGVMADALAENLYKTAGEVEPDLKKLIASLEGSHRNLRLAQASGKLATADRAYLGQVCEVLAQQKRQAQALIAYAQSNPRNVEFLREWRTARAKSGEIMKKLLGDDEGPAANAPGAEKPATPPPPAKTSS